MTNEQVPNTNVQLPSLTFQTLQSLYTQISASNSQLPTLEFLQNQIDHLNGCQKFNDSGGPVVNRVADDANQLMLKEKIDEKRRSKDQIIHDQSRKNGEIVRQIQEKKMRLSSGGALRDCEMNYPCVQNLEIQEQITITIKQINELKNKIDQNKTPDVTNAQAQISQKVVEDEKEEIFKLKKQLQILKKKEELLNDELEQIGKKSFRNFDFIILEIDTMNKNISIEIEKWWKNQMESKQRQEKLKEIEQQSKQKLQIMHKMEMELSRKAKKQKLILEEIGKLTKKERDKYQSIQKRTPHNLKMQLIQLQAQNKTLSSQLNWETRKLQSLKQVKINSFCHPDELSALNLEINAINKVNQKYKDKPSQLRELDRQKNFACMSLVKIKKMRNIEITQKNVELQNLKMETSELKKKNDKLEKGYKEQMSILKEYMEEYPNHNSQKQHLAIKQKAIKLQQKRKKKEQSRNQKRVSSQSEQLQTKQSQEMKEIQFFLKNEKHKQTLSKRLKIVWVLLISLFGPLILILIGNLLI